MPVPLFAAPSAGPAGPACPACATRLALDERFPTWCPGCEWNLSPAPADAPVLPPRRRRISDRRQRADAALLAAARSRAGQVYEAVAEGAGARQDRTWIAAMAVAALVHLVTGGLLAASVALQFTGSWPLRAIGWTGLALAVLLRPRFGRVPKDAGVLGRAAAPTLYALVDRVAAAVGGRPVDVVRVTGEFNASFGRVGLRRRSVLTLGLSLWEPLTGGQRLALLGHELGHDVNGDHRSSRWLGSAIGTLNQWWYVSLPDPHAGRTHALEIIAHEIANLFLEIVNRLVGLLLGLLVRLADRSGQGAEYRADALAAEVASTAAAQDMLRVLLLDRTVETFRARQRSLSGIHRPGIPRGPAVFWSGLAEELATVPPQETERLLRLSTRELGSVDSTHPPTHLRIAMLARRPVLAPSVVLTDAEEAAIALELARHRDRLARELLA
ncbi:M48 family metallopeptidase [Kitasatospora sp. NPDC057223]|uniref:M48 family metallopeptidase n=1 Tax=Kitasatospora sp. NPDC057223 TaxID=3346055 RepID=UPI0036315F8F